MASRSRWGPLAIIITLLGAAALIFGFVVFAPAIFGSASQGSDLDKYRNNSVAGNETAEASNGMNDLFVGFYSGPLQILLYIVGIFLIIAALAFAVSINRRRKGR